MGEQDFREGPPLREDGVLDDDVLKEALRAVAQEVDTDHHPELDILLSYHLGELDAAQAATVRGHIAGCLECTEALVDFDEFSADPTVMADQVPTDQVTADQVSADQVSADQGATDPVSDDDLAELWRSIESGLAVERGDPDNLRTFRPSVEVSAVPAAEAQATANKPWASLAWQAAAVVLLACGLSVGILRWYEPSTGPQAWSTWPLLRVSAIEGSSVRGGSEVRRLPPGDDDEWIHLLFELPSTVSYDRYIAELQGPDGEALTSSPEILRRGPFLIPSVQHRTFPIGRTTIRLYGLGEEGRTLVGTFLVERAGESAIE